MIPANASPATIHKVLDRLAHDHEFRELMLGVPATALKEYGIPIDTAKVPHVRRLPSMGTCARISEQAAPDALSQAGIIIFCR